MKRFKLWWWMFLAVLVWATPAEAARQYTVTMTSPAAPAQFDMGTTQALSLSVTNTSNGGNAGERIYEMRFRLNGTGTVFSATTAAPAGWTRRSFSSTSVTFRATSWATAIPTGSSTGFTLALALNTSSANVTETLRDARASFTTDTNFGNGITRSGRTTINSPASWTRKGLQITSFQTVDISTGLPISTIVAGQSFRLVMRVSNLSTATQSGIIASPNPPTANKTGTVTQGLTSTVYSPNPLTLGSGASGTITFTYTTAASNNGTISFAAYARNSGNTTTSRTALSNVLTVSGGSFIANLAVSPACAYIGQSFTVTMNLTNSYSYGITGITPTLSPTVGGIVSLTSGPTPATRTLAASTTLNGAFQWTYLITGGTAGQTLAFSGTASGTASSPGSGTKTTPAALSATVTRGGFMPTADPPNTNADSSAAEISFGITNIGCGTKVQSVSISYPAGWTYGGDGYSQDETWNPPAGAGPVVFSAPAAANQINYGGSGSYSLVLNTPIATGTYLFTLIMTDSLGATVTQTVPVTLDPFNSGSPSLNQTNSGTWREEFR